MSAGDNAMNFRLGPLPDMPLVEAPRPVADFPEYWLGQLKTIDDQERKGVLTKAQMVSEIHRVIDALREWDKHKITRSQGRMIGSAQMP